MLSLVEAIRKIYFKYYLIIIIASPIVLTGILIGLDLVEFDFIPIATAFAALLLVSVFMLIRLEFLARQYTTLHMEKPNGYEKIPELGYILARLDIWNIHRLL